MLHIHYSSTNPSRSLIRRVSFAAVLLAAATACSGDSPTPPTAPTAPSAPATIRSLAITGTQTFTTRGATAQFTATATLSDGTTQDRTSTSIWQSSDTNVATVSAQGLVTAQRGGSASISAAFNEVSGTRAVTVDIPVPVNRVPDPQAGARLPLPDVQGLIAQLNAARPDLLAQSCNRGIKYVNNPWQDYIIDGLRQQDTRWGYNAKPTRTAADNNGVPVVAAGDEIAYNPTNQPDEGNTNVYLVDILEQHCGTSPRLTWRVFTGEEPGRWTGAGRF